MLADLIRRLANPSIDDRALDEADARIAVAGLLVGAALADQRYDAREQAVIEQALAARYSLTPAAASALRREGEEAERKATDLYRFTSLIKASVAYEERAPVIEALWRVMLADKVRDPHEETMMRRVTDLLGLDPRDSIEARRKVERDL
jgi:uncharacterized tellurite resistance protein B-like protein